MEQLKEQLAKGTWLMIDRKSRSSTALSVTAVGSTATASKTGS